MKCHAGVEFPSGQPCPKCNAKLGEVCWPGINSDLAELPQARERLEKAEWVLKTSGFIRCNSPACNCNSWHHVGGFYARFAEIKEVVEEAGYSTNGRTLLDAVKALIVDKSDTPATPAICKTQEAQ